MKAAAAAAAGPLPIPESVVESVMLRAAGIKAQQHEAAGLGKGYPKGLTDEDRASLIDLSMLVFMSCETIKIKLPAHKAAALDTNAVVRHGVPVIIKYFGFAGFEYIDEVMLGMVAWAVITAQPGGAE